MLIDLGIWENPEHHHEDLEPVFVPETDATYVPASAIVQGACLLQFCFPNSQAFIADPLCLCTWHGLQRLELEKGVPEHIAKERAEHKEKVCKIISSFLRHQFEKREALYLPINCPQRWTLLVVERVPSLRARYWDSLPNPKKANIAMGEALLKDCLGLDIEMPARHNFARQSEPTCGFFVLSFMEEDWRKRLQHGSASQGQSHSRNVHFWRQKLQRLSISLESERVKLKEDIEKRHAKAGSRMRRSDGPPCGFGECHGER